LFNLRLSCKRIFKTKILLPLAGSEFGMSVTELMVGICIVAILAAAGIPFYINYFQQAGIVSSIIPRLHLIEANICYYYVLNSRLPGQTDIGGILADIDTKNLDIDLASGTVTLIITENDKQSKLHILDGKILVASPVVTKDRVVAWHLSGELADRLKITY
jgi:type II secretory pathway pseudopilin PulG